MKVNKLFLLSKIDKIFHRSNSIEYNIYIIFNAEILVLYICTISAIKKIRLSTM